jgi:hypothetical protein
MRAPCFAAVAVLLSARSVHANGRFPQANQIVFSTTDPNLVIARTTYAILPSHDDGATWQFLCEDVVGLGMGTTADPEIGLTSGNALVASVSSPPGLSVSTDTGCSWSCAAGTVANQNFADLVVRPNMQHSVLALSSTSVTIEGGVGFRTQVFESSDDGANWNALGLEIPDPLFRAQTIDVATTDAQRIYVSGARGFGQNISAAVWVSRDGAQSWKETRLPPALFDPTKESSIYIGAVDPMDADRLYIRSSALPSGGESRLSMSTTGGSSFMLLQSFDIGLPLNCASLGEFLGFALSPDGSKIYAGTAEQGLWMAMRSDMTFHQMSKIGVGCLATRGNELWACSDAVSTKKELGAQFVIGVSIDDGATFVGKLKSVSCLQGPITCSGARMSLGCNATVTGAQCRGSYDLFCQGAYDPNGVCNCGGSAAGAVAPAHGGAAAMGNDSGAARDGSQSGADATSVARPSSPPPPTCALSAKGRGGTMALIASGALAIASLARRRVRRAARPL